jgi:mannan endo-1,6-alpha-mannosidase
VYQTLTFDRSFKGIFARFMAASIKWMPELYDIFNPIFQTSARAAAAQCTGNPAGVLSDGHVCGFTWTESPRYDGTWGFGQQMDALQIISANLIQRSRHPVTAKSGGISRGDPSAGTGGDTFDGTPPLGPVTKADKAGAGVLTGVVLLAWLYLAYFMVT